MPYEFEFPLAGPDETGYPHTGLGPDYPDQRDPAHYDEVAADADALAIGAVYRTLQGPDQQPPQGPAYPNAQPGLENDAYRANREAMGLDKAI